MSSTSKPTKRPQIASATFLVRRMSDQLREALEAESKARDISLQDVMREILCAHYELDCEPVGPGVRKEAEWNGSPTVLLKMQPLLFSAIKKDAADSGESMRSLVLGALESRYVTSTGGNPR